MMRPTTDLRALQAIDFAIQETVLYLDAYPGNSNALAYYHQLLKERETLMDTIENHRGPMTMYGNKSHTSWDWTDKPWPWEFDAN